LKSSIDYFEIIFSVMETYSFPTKGEERVIEFVH